MRLWRICRDRWAVSGFDGKGARQTGGRWNRKGEAVVYTSLALAALELFVHLDPSEMPDDLVTIALDVPDDVAIRRISKSDLPRNWRNYPAPERLKEIGSKWIRTGEELLMIVPSAVVPLETNVLINPAHADFARCSAGSPAPFHFDPRMWK
jgi:RES domain-containing protein